MTITRKCGAVIFLPILLAGIFTCNLDDSIRFSRIDITGARALMVAPLTGTIKGGRSAAPGSPTFVKILADSSIEAIDVTDASGNPTAGIVPSMVMEVNSSFVIIIIDQVPYLVSKIDGSAYDLSPVGTPQQLFTDSGLSGQTRKSIYTDSLGNIYYLSIGIVKKIDITNPDSVTAVNYTPDVDSVGEFAVSSGGDVIYRAYGVKRIKKSNSGLYNLQNNMYAFWIGNDGKIYDVQSVDYGGSSNGIKRIDIDGSYNVSVVDFSTVSPITYQGYQYAWLYLQDRIIGICDSSYEFENPSHAPRSISFPFLAYDKRKIVKCSSAYWYVATKQGLIHKVNPIDDSYVTYLSQNEYDFYIMDITVDDVVYFGALRMSDGKKVLGKVASDGTLSIIDDTLPSDVILLTKVK